MSRSKAFDRDEDDEVVNFIRKKLVEQFRIMGIGEDEYGAMVNRVVSETKFIRVIRYFNPRTLAATLYLLGSGSSEEIFDNRDANLAVADFISRTSPRTSRRKISVAHKSTILRYARAIESSEST